MKKFLFLLMVLFPLSVSADASSPRIVSYDAIVTNPEGAKVEIVSCRDLIFIWNETGETDLIEYDTKIKILQEVEGKGFFTYDDKCASIELNDIRAYDDNINLTEFKKEDEKKRLLTYGEIYLYKGPSEVYGKLNNEVKIPAGEIIEYEYHDDYWCYVTYNGVSGWIQMEVVNEKYASEEEKAKVKVAPEIKEKIILNNDIEYVYVGPSSEEKISVKIPKSTILESHFGIKPYMAPITTSLYIEYNEILGWLKNDFSVLYVDNILNYNGATLYKEGNTNSEVLSTIPYNLEVNVFAPIYEFVEGFRKVEYNGLIGYVKEEDFDETVNSKPIEPEIPEEDKEPNVPIEPEEDKEPNVPIESEKTDDTEKAENNSNGMDSSWHIKNVILTVFFCIILALVTLVTILLINKKKKSKEVEIIKIEGNDKE